MHYLAILLAISFFGLYPTALMKFAKGQIDVLSYLTVFSIVAALSQWLFLTLSPKLRDAPRDLHQTALTQTTLRLGASNAVFNTLAYGAFFWAISHGDAVRATVFLELWASVFLIFTMIFRRGEPGGFDHHQGLPTTIGFFAVGVFGVILISTAKIAAVTGTDVTTAVQSDSVSAVLIGAAAPVLMAISFMFGTRNARTISGHLAEAVGLARTAPATEPAADTIKRQHINFIAGIYHGLFLRVFATVIMLTVLLVAWFGFDWRPMLGTADFVFFAGVILCALISSAGSTLANIANNLSASSNLNMIWAFAPFLGILFLRHFGYADTTPPDVYYGAILILAANFMLTTKTTHSIAFRLSILSLCVLAYVVLFTAPLREESSVQYVALPLGVFGILAAFFIDRVARADYGSDPKIEPAAMFSQNIFTLWILGFGSIVTMALFRETGVMSSDMTIVILGVAVVYMCVLPIERFIAPLTRSDGNDELVPHLIRVGLSALFLLTLFVLLLLAFVAASA